MTINQNNYSNNLYKKLLNKQNEIFEMVFGGIKDEECILWIIPELYYSSKQLKSSYTVTLIFEDDSYKEYRLKVRTPYPNKHYIQGYSSINRKRIMGIPIKFNNFSELNKLKKVEIECESYEKWYLNNLKALNIECNKFKITYNLKFENSLSKNNIYTLFSRHTLDFNLVEENFLDEYSSVWGFNANAEYYLDSWKMENLNEWYEFKGSLGDSASLEELLSYYASNNSVPNENAFSSLLKEVSITNEIYCNFNCFKKEETLVPHSLVEVPLINFQ